MSEVDVRTESAGVVEARADGVVTAIRWLFGLYFIAVGVVHFVVPEGLPSPLAWMYELSTTLHITAGTLEILGGLGLILPRATGVLPRLTAAAAAGLAALMVAAIAWHIGRDEWTSAIMNFVVATSMAYVAVHESRRTAG